MTGVTLHLKITNISEIRKLILVFRTDTSTNSCVDGREGSGESVASTDAWLRQLVAEEKL